MKRGRWCVTKLIFIFLVLIVSFIIYNVYTSYGAPFDKVMPKASGGGSTVSRNELDNLYILVSEADNLLQKSLVTVLKMVANKDEIEEIARRLKEIENIKEPKEYRSAMDTVVSDAQSVIERAMEKQKTQEKIQALDAQQKQLLGNTIFNIFLAGLKDKAAVEKAQQLSQAIQSNPASGASLAADLDKIRTIITTLPPQIDKTFKIGNNLAKLAQANKIEAAIPKSSSEKAKDANLPGSG